MPSGRRSSKRPWAGPHPELDVERARAGTRRESGPDGEWVVRALSGASATKTYVCPGCRQEIPPGTAHVVAWRADHLLGDEAAVAERRHWHSGCWRARDRRR
jgi:hypothetical protein